VPEKEGGGKKSPQGGRKGRAGAGGERNVTQANQCNQWSKIEFLNRREGRSQSDYDPEREGEEGLPEPAERNALLSRLILWRGKEGEIFPLGRKREKGHVEGNGKAVGEGSYVGPPHLLHSEDRKDLEKKGERRPGTFPRPSFEHEKKADAKTGK